MVWTCPEEGLEEDQEAYGCRGRGHEVRWSERRMKRKEEGGGGGGFLWSGLVFDVKLV